MKSHTNYVTKFDAAITALQHAMQADLEFADALRWDARFKSLYQEHVEDVINSSADFVPLAINLEGRLKALVELSKEGDGVTPEIVESVMGVKIGVLKAFLSRFRVNDDEALLYVGGGQIVTFDLPSIVNREVH